MSQKPESKLQKAIQDELKKRGAWAVKVHGNMYTRGLPDIMACYRGVCLGLEVKVPGREKTLTPLQASTLRSIRAAGGYAYMVTSVEQALKVLRKIDRDITAQVQLAHGAIAFVEAYKRALEEPETWTDDHTKDLVRIVERTGNA